jgi:L-asparagine oxygenase
LLLCLRGDEHAYTTLSSIFEVLPLLPASVVDTLFQPRFRTAVDESYLHGRANVLGAPMPVLSGERDRPTMVFDADLMVGTDQEADDALRTLSAAVEGHHTRLALQAGDLLVVDNNVAVHGRSPYSPRFDGYDRWLQRSMAVTDLSASAGERNGRVIVTRFGA